VATERAKAEALAYLEAEDIRVSSSKRIKAEALVYLEAEGMRVSSDDVEDRDG
jgi:hypothetical protein